MEESDVEAVQKCVLDTIRAQKAHEKRKKQIQTWYERRVKGTRKWLENRRKKPMWYAKKGNKYNSQKQTYNGYSYMSKKEAQKAFDLDMLKKAGEVLEWKRQVKIDLRVNGLHICNYYVDFEILWKGGQKELLEVKGFSTDLWKLKWKLFEAIYSKEHPEYKLTVEY